MAVALNITLFFVPLVVAKIREWDSNWNITLGLFLCTSAVSIVLSFVLFIYDKRNGGVLSKGKQKSPTHSNPEEEPLLNHISHEETMEEEQAFTAKVITEGIIVSAPLTYVHHHHHLSHSQGHSKDCRCFESEENFEYDAPPRSRSPHRGHSPVRKTSPIRRIHPPN